MNDLKMRKQYETAKDKEREHWTKREYERFQLERNNIWDYQERPKKARSDYLVHDEQGRCIAELEIKCRDFNHGEHDTIVLSWSKISHAQKIMQAGRRFVFIVSLKDKIIRYVYSDAHNLKAVKAGRTKNTRDQYDVELVAYIPVKHFETIREFGYATRPRTKPQG